jgi:hypothetical protein
MSFFMIMPSLCTLEKGRPASHADFNDLFHRVPDIAVCICLPDDDTHCNVSVARAPSRGGVHWNGGAWHVAPSPDAFSGAFV